MGGGTLALSRAPTFTRSVSTYTEAAMNTSPVIAEGLAYDPTTRDWTDRVQYAARDRMEAIRWINFNRNWLKSLHIVED